MRGFWLPWYMNVNVAPQDAALVPLYVVMDSVLCLKKKMTLKDGDPEQYSSKW